MITVTIDTGKHRQPIEMIFDDNVLMVMKQGQRFASVNTMQQEVMRISLTHLLHVAEAHGLK